MKTFLNVLYRRILYKIPLKLLLVLLAIFGLLFACTKAEDVSDLLVEIHNDSVSFNGLTNLYTFNSSDYNNVYCVDIKNISPGNNGGSVFRFDLGVSTSSSSFDSNFEYTSFWGDWGDVSYCFFVSQYSPYLLLRVGNNNLISTNLDYTIYNLTNLLNTPLPVYTSLQCQSEYSLIPISEVDSSYCQSNNLCPSGGIPSDCPNVGVSNLFINDIFHPGAFNIIMNIPEEISRDYAYTNSGYNFNLDIEGYNVDYEKMQSVIDSQSYIPTEEDFQNIIAILTPYTKIIVFFVFLFIVWAWIKKPFKSKKL